MLVKNFLFHRVSPDEDRLWPPMTPQLFERIIQYLSKHFQIVCLEEWLPQRTDVGKGKALATIMFDDGYKDNIEYAAPILDKYKCPASFYVVTESISNDIPTWTYVLDHLLQQSGKDEIVLALDYVPAELQRIRLKDAAIVRRLKPWMKLLPNIQRVEIARQVAMQCDDVPAPKGQMMNWDNVRELHRAGFYIGSHSATHPLLGALEDEEEIRRELRISGNKISQELGSFPATISYPIGSFDDRVKRIAIEEGYQYGLAVEQRFYNSAADDIMEIPRVELYQEAWWKTGLRISGIYQKARRLWK